MLTLGNSSSAQAILLGAVSAFEAPSSDRVIKGNVNRKGERIYHIWEIMKKMALVAEPDIEEHVAEQSAIVLALTAVLPKVSFVEIPDPFEAQNLLLIDVRKAIRAEIDSTKGGS